MVLARRKARRTGNDGSETARSTGLMVVDFGAGSLDHLLVIGANGCAIDGAEVVGVSVATDDLETAR